MTSELVIRGATVLDPDTDLRVADILVVDGLITEVGHVGRVGGGSSHESIDATGLIAMPGLINAHTHSGQALDRGIAPNLPLDLWLMWVVYGGIALDPDDSYTLAAAGAIEMIETGCTAVLDHPWVPIDGFDDHAEAIVTAYADVGIRAGLAPMIQDRDIFESMSFGGAEPPEPMSEPVDPVRFAEAMERFLARWTGAPRSTPMVGPSAPQRCSDELLRLLVGLAARHDAPFHTHVLETRTQVVATRDRYGRSVVEMLDELGALGPRTSLAHGVWMDADEFALVRDSGATIVHNPVSNLRCGSGLLPLAGLLEGGVSVALGADGAASNDNQNMFETMKIAALVQTLTGTFRRWPTADDIWRACLHGGAAAMCQPIGRLRPGHRADIVLLDVHRHPAVERDALVRSLVFAEHGESVDSVFVDGVRLSGEGGRVDRDHRDHRDIRIRARALQHRIHASLPARRALLDRFGEVLGTVHDQAMAAPVAVERLGAVTPAFAEPAFAGRGTKELTHGG